MWEKCTKSSTECSGLLNTDFSIVTDPRECRHTVGCLGVPFLNLKTDLMYPMGCIEYISDIMEEAISGDNQLLMHLEDEKRHTNIMIYIIRNKTIGYC